MNAKQRRRYTAAPDNCRCSATVTLKDGSLARCMRTARYEYRRCWQHRLTR